MPSVPKSSFAGLTRVKDSSQGMVEQNEPHHSNQTLAFAAARASASRRPSLPPPECPRMNWASGYLGARSANNRGESYVPPQVWCKIGSRCRLA